MRRRLSVVLLGLSACSGVASSSVAPSSPPQSEPRAEVEPVVTTDSNTAPEASRTAPHQDLDAFVAFVAEAARLDDREALALATADPLPSPTGTILDRQAMLDSEEGWRNEAMADAEAMAADHAAALQQATAEADSLKKVRGHGGSVAEMGGMKCRCLPDHFLRCLVARRWTTRRPPWMTPPPHWRLPRPAVPRRRVRWLPGLSGRRHCETSWPRSRKQRRRSRRPSLKSRPELATSR